MNYNPKQQSVVRPWWRWPQAAAFITGANNLLAAQQRFNTILACRPELAESLARRNRVWGTYLEGADEIFWLASYADTLADLGYSAKVWLEEMYQ